MGYIVTAPLVIAVTESGTRQYFYEGAPLPDSMDKDELKRLEADGLISSSDKPADEPVDGAPKGNASREEWAAYAKSKGAPDEETADGGLTQTELRAKYGK